MICPPQISDFEFAYLVSLALHKSYLMSLVYFLFKLSLKYITTINALRINTSKKRTRSLDIKSFWKLDLEKSFEFELIAIH